MPRRRDWETLYRNEKVEDLPWYNERLDSDLKKELKRYAIKHKSLLDLGTGPGTQAALLSKMGLKVTATDISPTAIENARTRFSQVNFLTDDILKTKILPDSFDYIFDRGCFHTLLPRSRPKYVRTVHMILRDKGTLFLKCFSTKERMKDGPYRFSKDQIIKIFEEYFMIKNYRASIFETPTDLKPKALFFVMVRK